MRYPRGLFRVMGALGACRRFAVRVEPSGLWGPVVRTAHRARGGAFEVIGGLHCVQAISCKGGAFSVMGALGARRPSI